MLRKGFAMVFVLASMLVFASALAKTECSVLIDHVELNAQNNFIERAGGLALLDAADNTLRLYNFSADRISCNQSLTIDFAGKNTILGGIALPIVTSGNLTLTAERSADTLALRATEGTALKTYKTVINGGTVIIDSGDNCAIETDGDLVINGGTVQVKGTGGPHDWSTQLARCNGSLILNNGSLTVSAMPGLGLVITQDLVINGGSLTATAQTEEALVAVGHITLNGGSLTVSSQQNEGMMYGEGFTINDGKLVAMGKHRAFGSGNSINITANYRLRTSSNGGFANSGAGWLENFCGPYCEIETLTAQCIVDGQTTSHRTLEDAWRTAQQAKGPATVKILGDCTLAKLFVVQSGCQITLDLNGCTLDASAFEVAAGGQFTLTDTAAADAAKQGTITGTKVGAVNVADGGTFIMQGGTLTGNSAVNGGAVNVAYGGTFLMQGGVLTGNTAANGGAVYNDGAFVMTGGKILDNRAQQGGGVYNAGAMRVEGGSIIGNKANEGGGVFQTGPRLELANDAVISGNVRPADGAADNLCLDWDAETDGETHTLSIGAMGENAKVFLNSKREPTLDSPTTISANSNVTASNLAKLHADNPDRCLQLWDGTVYLNVHKLMEYQTERALYRKPTCLGNAVYYYSCDSCGMLSPDETFTAQGTALGHRWRPYMAFYADHFKHYHVCSGCNLQDAGEPHVWNIPEATETESKYCTICNYVLQAATGHAHELELVLGSAPDCVTNGILSHYECESGKHYEDANGLREIPDPAANELIPAVGHSWTPTFLMENADAERHYLGCSACGDMDVGMLHEWNVVTATLETDKHCTVCGYVAEPRLEHAHQGIFVPERPARCGVDGEKAYYRCDCGMCFHDEACTQPIEDFGTWKVIHAQPHKWSANYLPAYSDAQHHYHVCTVCGALDAGEDHLWTEAEGGGRRCEVCGYGGAAAPLTGDSTPLGTYLALLVLSGAGLAAAITRRKKQRI